jgi:hypothetical protein
VRPAGSPGGCAARFNSTAVWAQASIVVVGWQTRYILPLVPSQPSCRLAHSRAPTPLSEDAVGRRVEQRRALSDEHGAREPNEHGAGDWVAYCAHISISIFRAFVPPADIMHAHRVPHEQRKQLRISTRPHPADRAPAAPAPPRLVLASPSARGPSACRCVQHRRVRCARRGPHEASPNGVL